MIDRERYELAALAANIKLVWPEHEAMPPRRADGGHQDDGENAMLKNQLELAAKAAGVEIEPCTCSDVLRPFRTVDFHRGRHWAPNVSNADSRSLQIALRMSLELCENEDGEYWKASAGDAAAAEWVVLNHDGDHESAARMAVLRCAVRVAQLNGLEAKP